MILKRWISQLVMVLSLGLVFGACSDDKKPDEAVEPVDIETPASPPEHASDFDADEATAPIYFGFDDYTLDYAAQESLGRLADFMRGSSSAVVQIEGHCDERGSIEYNLALGQRRAQSVKNYLTQLGIEDARLPTISYGEEKPAAEGHSEDAWSKNRRAEFVLSQP